MQELVHDGLFHVVARPAVEVFVEVLGPEHADGGVLPARGLGDVGQVIVHVALRHDRDAEAPVLQAERQLPLGHERMEDRERNELPVSMAHLPGEGAYVEPAHLEGFSMR